MCVDCFHLLRLSQVFKQPWPGVMRTVYGNHQRFETTYFKKFPGYYVTGDGKFEQRPPPGVEWLFLNLVSAPCGR